MAHDGTTTGAAVPRPEPDYHRLPDPVRVEDTITSKEAAPVADPQAGRDTERDFMLRYAG